ncbi:hypothetical protein TWF173_003664 [Orbilia oligospora]|nr:hypothetical protein TWF173_003664 [Orbilia oligospora]
MPTPQSGSLATCALRCLSSSDVRILTGCEAETCYCNNSTNLKILNDCVDKSCPKGFQGTDRDNPFFGDFYCSKSNSGMTINQVDTPTSLVQLVNTVSSSRLLSSTISSSMVTTTATANNGAAATAVSTTLPATNAGTVPPFPSERKPAAAIIGGTIGGISAVICITTITIHKVRNRRRKKRALARLAELQGRNLDSGYEVNGISRAGGNEEVKAPGVGVL